MKITHFLILISFLLSTACKKDDDAPVDQLPPATQTGAQTFGCLIDGIPLVPDNFGANKFTAFYQNIDGFYFLGISMSSGNGDAIRALAIQGTKTNFLEKKDYSLETEGEGKFNGLLILGRPGDNLTVRTSDNLPGNLRITEHDPANFILSGTFEFTVLDNNGKEIKITDGRFDVKYTN